MLFYCLLGLTSLVSDTMVIRKELPAVEVSTTRTQVVSPGEMPVLVGAPVLRANLENRMINLNTNQARQIFAGIPGVQVWEQDGNQVAISYRGLSPNRSWEIGMRQQMMPVSADPYGYPESYYSPPFEAISSIDIIRSGASLMCGPQAGGVVNYRIRNNFEKTFSGSASLQAGSFSQKSGFIQLTANKKGWNLNTFFSRRESNGFRPNAGFTNQNGYVSLSRREKKFDMQLSCTFYRMLAGQPGGLTDSMFAQNIRQSLRNRNWLCVQGIIPGISASWRPNTSLSLGVLVAGFAGGRHSVGFVAPITTIDKPGADGLFSNRQADRDFYNHYTADIRGSYQFEKIPVLLTAGITRYHGNINRKQFGKGNRDSNYNLELFSPYERDLDLATTSNAAYLTAEYKFAKGWQAAGGIRYEQIQSAASGRTGFSSGQEILLASNELRKRNIALPYAGISYNTGKWKFFTNLSAFFRPVLYSETIPILTNDSVSPNLRDAGGYQAEAGFSRSGTSGVGFQLTAFYLQYQNKVGTYQLLRSPGKVLQVKTNLGASLAYGCEGMMDYKHKFGTHFSFSGFMAATLMQATYSDYTVTKTAGGIPYQENNKGKQLENAPSFILRTGLECSYKMLRAGAQFAYTEKSFSDALNTLQAPANAQIGLIPAYAVFDIFAGANIGRYLQLDAGISNLLNRVYFTRRASGYPGPGIIPADPRNVFVRIKFSW